VLLLTGLRVGIIFCGCCCVFKVWLFFLSINIASANYNKQKNKDKKDVTRGKYVKDKKGDM